MRGLLVAAAAPPCCLVAPAAHAGGPTLVVGAAEDDVKAGTLVEAKAKLDLLKLAGLDAVRITSIWDPADPRPAAGRGDPLNNVTAAAQLDGDRGVRVGLQLRQQTTPLTDDDQANFAHYAAELAREVPDLQNFIVGNEPNLNRFWLPQFNADGTDAAAPAY